MLQDEGKQLKANIKKLEGSLSAFGARLLDKVKEAGGGDAEVRQVDEAWRRFTLGARLRPSGAGAFTAAASPTRRTGRHDDRR